MQYSRMAVWQNGRMAEWQNGRMAERQNGRTAEWQNGMALLGHRRFLLGTGRMPHPVGGAIGVTLCHCRYHLIKYSLNIH